MAAELPGAADKLLSALLLPMLFVTAHSRNLQPPTNTTLSASSESSDYSTMNITTPYSPDSVPEDDENCSLWSWTNEMILSYDEAQFEYQLNYLKCPNGTEVCEAALPPPYLDVGDYEQQVARRKGLFAQTPSWYWLLDYGWKRPFPSCHGNKSPHSWSCKWKKYYEEYNCKKKTYVLKKVEEKRMKEAGMENAAQSYYSSSSI